MAQRASLRDHTSLAVEKRRSNRTVHILRSGARAAWREWRVDDQDPPPRHLRSRAANEIPDIGLVSDVRHSFEGLPVMTVAALNPRMRVASYCQTALSSGRTDKYGFA